MQLNAITQPRTQQHAQPKKQEEGACIIGGEDLDNRFLSSHKRKTDEEKERGNSQPSNHQERTTLSFVSFYLFLYLKSKTKSGLANG